MSLPPKEVLSIEKLTVTFSGDRGDTVALDSFTLTLQAGEVLALVGESGSGKSTAGFALGGLLPAENARIEGRFSFGDFSCEASDFHSLQKICGRRIGFVFQEPSTALHPAMRIQTQVAEAIHLRQSRPQRKERVIQLLKSVQLEPDLRLLRAFPHHLSGGMQQRVVLAMALANDPEILVADEPTTALDPTIRREVLTLIRDLALRAGSAVLLITHDFGVVSHFADRVAVLHRGRIVERGPTSQVIAQPADPYTQTLVATAKEVGGTGK